MCRGVVSTEGASVSEGARRGRLIGRSRVRGVGAPARSSPHLSSTPAGRAKLQSTAPASSSLHGHVSAICLLDCPLHRLHFDLGRLRLAFEIASVRVSYSGLQADIGCFDRARSAPLIARLRFIFKPRARLGFARPQQNFKPRMGMG